MPSPYTKPQPLQRLLSLSASSGARFLFSQAKKPGKENWRLKRRRGFPPAKDLWGVAQGFGTPTDAGDEVQTTLLVPHAGGCLTQHPAMLRQACLGLRNGAPAKARLVDPRRLSALRVPVATTSPVAFARRGSCPASCRARLPAQHTPPFPL